MVIDAEQLLPQTADAVALWCGGVVVEETDPQNRTKKFAALNVPTLGGVRRAQEGDYIVKGVQGEFNVIAQRAFESTYELMPNAS